MSELVRKEAGTESDLRTRRLLGCVARAASRAVHERVAFGGAEFASRSASQLTLKQQQLLRTGPISFGDALNLELYGSQVVEQVVQDQAPVAAERE